MFKDVPFQISESGLAKNYSKIVNTLALFVPASMGLVGSDYVASWTKWDGNALCLKNCLCVGCRLFVRMKTCLCVRPEFTSS